MKDFFKKVLNYVSLLSGGWVYILAPLNTTLSPGGSSLLKEL